MKVTIDPDSGFCFGVNHAIELAEQALRAGETVYSLGELVHNQVQMDKLKGLGLKVITRDELPLVSGETVLFRAHGEPPETFRLAEQLGIKVINATCPIVIKLQQRVSESASVVSGADMQVVIFGKKGHAEVAGLVGNARNKALVIENDNDFSEIDLTRPVHLFSQTTMDGQAYEQVGEALRQRMAEKGNFALNIQKSVCRQVSGRAPSLRTFAKAHDVIVFVSGKNSANGNYLFGICKAENSRSYFVGSAENIDKQWFENALTVGVSGATSTPGWLIEQVAAYIAEI